MNAEQFFDADWYLSKYPDVAAAGVDPWSHYSEHGGREGRDPHPLFCGRFYLAQYPDVAAATVNPLEHFLLFGATEQRDPHPVFSSRYVAQKLRTAGDPFRGYLRESEESRLVSPHPLFDAEWYVSQLDKNEGARPDPLTHYITVGAHRGLDPHRLFSTDFYLARYNDVENAGFNPLLHFIEHGAAEDRDPHPAFLTGWYRENFMQDSPRDYNPLLHFLTEGVARRLPTHPLFPMQLSVRDEHPVLSAITSGGLVFHDTRFSADLETILEDKRREVEQKSGLHAFLLFNHDAISGGIFSIFSIAAELRRLGREAQIYSFPGPPIGRYRRFKNSEIILSFDDLLSAISAGHVDTLHVPEVLLVSLLELPEVNFSRVRLNILNQNGELMPDRTNIQPLVTQFAKTTMTTAHERYSKALHARRWATPIKHISTYMSYDDYQSVAFANKSDMILLSPDRRAEDQHFIDWLTTFRGYRLFRVENLHYEFYKFCLPYVKYCVTLGEGLDNYFIETIFTGGIAFAVYNPTFMPGEMKRFPNVFQDIDAVKVGLNGLVRDIERDEAFRSELHGKNYSFLKTLYDKAIYRRKISEFLSDHYDHLPEHGS